MYQMKTLKLSLFALIVIVSSSCKKEIKPSVSADEEIVISNRVQGAAPQSNGTPKPLLIASQSPAPVSVGNQVTVTYTAKDPSTNSTISCGKVTIYMYNGAEWVEVATSTTPVATYSFTPTTADDCAYQFKAGFAPGGGDVNCQGSYAGVNYEDGTAFCVDVIQQTCVTTFTIGSNVSAVNLNNGLYEFTITYTLTSPVDVSNVKFQGGATAGGNSGHSITDYGNTVVVNANNNNTVVKWVGDLKACTPQTVSFKYTRNFSCPATDAYVTGDWSASTSTQDLGTISRLTYSCN